jgi:PhnB protein
MATVSTYLNFRNSTEEAFSFYKKIFGTEYVGEGLMRFGDVPPSENMPPVTENEKKLIMHVSLPILGGHILMGSDAPDSMPFSVTQGNNVYIMLSPDTRAETKRLFKSLSEGAEIEQDLQEMFWGDYYGSLTDKYGIRWMFNCAEKE